MMADDNDEFFLELVKYHISGQLKVAPEHMSDHALYYMGKPSFDVYRRFKERYERINAKLGKKQYLVPYLMSSHPGAELSDAVHLAEYLHSIGYMPQQVQDFYPTPGTLSTAMYYSGVDPRTMKPVYVAKTPEEKEMQRALLQWRRPDKRAIVIKALLQAGREDLIGYGKECLIRPRPNEHFAHLHTEKPSKRHGRGRNTQPSRRTDRTTERRAARTSNRSGGGRRDQKSNQKKKYTKHR